MVVGDGTEDSTNIVFNVTSNNVTVAGLKITNGYYGIYTAYSNSGKIEDCKIFGNHTAIAVRWAYYNLVTNNERHDNTGGGIWFDTMRNSIIENNIIYNNFSGIYVGSVINQP